MPTKEMPPQVQAVLDKGDAFLAKYPNLLQYGAFDRTTSAIRNQKGTMCGDLIDDSFCIVNE
jgi:hypothetical protein